MPSDHELLDAEVQQFEHEARRIAAGGWRRAVVGFALGAVAGVATALVLPRDEGPRRRLRPSDRPDPIPDPTEVGAHGRAGGTWDAGSSR